MTTSGSGRPPDAVRAVVVASWFPAVDDTTKGRFVADQVEALRATRAVEPVVVSFEPIQLSGGPIRRRRQVAAIRAATATAVASGDDVFAASGWSGPAGIPVARLPIPSGGRGLGAPAHQAEDRRLALSALAGRIGPDGRTVVHAHTGYPDGAAAVELSDRLDAPLVITEHATYVGQQLARPDLRRAYLAGVERAARLITVSQSLADELRAAIPEYASKLVVIPNAVAIADFSPGPRDSRRRDELLYVGYRTETKGIDVLLAAFARVRATRPTATLRLIGRSPTEEIEAGWCHLAAELGVAGAVSFEPPALRSDVAAAMSRADLLVHPSRRETFGVTPVEALASGLPVVATDIGALREILGTEPSGLGALVPTDDPAAFAAAIEDTLDRRDSFDPAALRASVEGRFGAAAVADRLVDLYEEVLAERGSQGSADRTGLPIHAAAASPAPPATLAIGFDTRRAGLLLGSLPVELRRSTWLVCSTGPATGDLPTDLGRTVAVGLDPSATRDEGDRAGPPKRRGRVGTATRRLSRSASDLSILTPLSRRRDRMRSEAVARARDELQADGEPSARFDVLCLDGPDYVARQSAGGHGPGRDAPGGIRWLADRWTAAEGSRSPVATADEGRR